MIKNNPCHYLDNLEAITGRERLPLLSRILPNFLKLLLSGIDSLLQE
jgi:hypothetical protein